MDQSQSKQNSDPNLSQASSEQDLNVELTQQIINQVDLAELSPNERYASVKKKMNVISTEVENLFWYHFFSLVGIAQHSKYPLTQAFVYLMRKAHELHYIEAAIRLGLVTPTKAKDKDKENGVSDNSESNREESASTPSSEDSPRPKSIILEDEDPSA